jgi:hypothetical protein
LKLLENAINTLNQSTFLNFILVLVYSKLYILQNILQYVILMCVRGILMRIKWKRRDIFTVVLAFAMLFCILLPVLGAPSGPSIFRYDDKKTGISNMVSNIVSPDARWTFDSGATHGSVPMAGDIDADGKMEVVWGSGEGILYALDESGQVEWTFAASGPLYAPPVIGDLDGEGIMEVV